MVILALELENLDGSARSGSEVYGSYRLLGFVEVMGDLYMAARRLHFSKHKIPLDLVSIKDCGITLTRSTAMVTGKNVPYI